MTTVNTELQSKRGSVESGQNRRPCTVHGGVGDVGRSGVSSLGSEFWIMSLIRAVSRSRYCAVGRFGREAVHRLLCARRGRWSA